MQSLVRKNYIHIHSSLPTLWKKGTTHTPSRGYSTIGKLPYYSRAMEEELYDEFGNYIGPEVKDSEEESVSVGRFRRVWRLIA